MTADPDEQVRRLVAYRGIDEPDARRRVGSQPMTPAKLSRADTVLDNTGEIMSLHRQIDLAWDTLNPGRLPIN